MCLVILAQSAIAIQPAKRPLNDPALRLDFESLLVRESAHDLQCPATDIAQPLRQGLAAVAGSGKQRYQPGKAATQATSQEPGPRPVVHIGRRHCHDQQQAEPIDSEVALAAFDPLAGVEAMTGGGLLNCLDALGIHDGGGWTHRTSRRLTRVVAQRVVNGLPGPIVTPQPEIVIDGAPRWEVVRQCPPGDPFPHDVKDRIDDLAPVDGGGTATRLRFRDVCLDVHPSGVGQVAGVWLP